MDARQLRKWQAPIKARLREDPSTARLTLAAPGRIDEDDVVCEVSFGHAVVKAVAKALDIRLQGGTVRAEGDPDFRGALGVDGDAAVVFRTSVCGSRNGCPRAVRANTSI